MTSLDVNSNSFVMWNDLHVTGDKKLSLNQESNLGALAYSTITFTAWYID